MMEEQERGTYLGESEHTWCGQRGERMQVGMRGA